MSSKLGVNAKYVYDIFIADTYTLIAEQCKGSLNLNAVSIVSSLVPFVISYHVINLVGLCKL